MSERPRKQAKQAVDSFLDEDRKPTWEEKKLIEERERTDASSFNGSMSSGINNDFDNNGLLSQRGSITSMESMEVEPYQTTQETISALMSKPTTLANHDRKSKQSKLEAKLGPSTTVVELGFKRPHHHNHRQQ